MPGESDLKEMIADRKRFLLIDLAHGGQADSRLSSCSGFPKLTKSKRQPQGTCKRGDHFRQAFDVLMSVDAVSSDLSDRYRRGIAENGSLPRLTRRSVSPLSGDCRRTP